MNDKLFIIGCAFGGFIGGYILWGLLSGIFWTFGGIIIALIVNYLDKRLEYLEKQKEASK